MSFSKALAARRPALAARADIIRSTREFFHSAEFLEVETPLRIPAPAPESHIDAFDASGWFLHTSPEICMKRLLAAGYERIFQVCHCWRAGERGRLHLPEFTMLEWYRADADYHALMNDCEALVRALAAEHVDGSDIVYRGERIELAGRWERLTVREAFQRYGDISMEESLACDRFDEVMVERIEPHLGREVPTFLTNYPACRGALARLKSDDPSVAERFELYVAGIELANGFSELNDVAEQRVRFQHEAAARADRNQPPYPFPERFLAELGAMPPSAGIALGMDRLIMLLLDRVSIDEVISFSPEEL